MKGVYRWVIIIVVVFMIGFLRTAVMIKNNAVKPTDSLVQGYVLKPPIVSGSNQYIKLRVVTYQTHSVVRLVLPRYPELSYGTVLSFRSNDLVQESYYYPDVTVLVEKRGNMVLALIYSLREEMVSRINKISSEPNSALISGIVLGVEGDLGEELDEKYRRAGLVHIIVASGYNVTVVIGLLGYLLRFIGRKQSALFIIIGIVAYAVLAGFEVPIVRASIMGVSVILAGVFGRQNSSLLWLLYASVSMIFINPKTVGTLSFQLSFGATLGILVFGSRIYDLMLFLPRLVREDTAMSLAAQVFVSPTLIFSIGAVSWSVLIVNILTLWLIPFVMFLSLTALAVSFISTDVAFVLIFPVEIALKYITWVVELFS